MKLCCGRRGVLRLKKPGAGRVNPGPSRPEVNNVTDRVAELIEAEHDLPRRPANIAA